MGCASSSSLNHQFQNALLPNYDDVTNFENSESSWPENSFKFHQINTEISEVKTKLKKSIGQFSILHFNDVYDVFGGKQGGVARFTAAFRARLNAIESQTGQRPLVLFSGDCLNPSMLSCATQGNHMIKIFNLIGVDVCVFGNHEFDFGVKHVINCIEQMNSRWLLSNVIDKLTGRMLAEGKRSEIIQMKNGLKIGLIGLVEEEWLETLTTIERNDLEYFDFVEVGRELARELREVSDVDVVIALTHMRWPNDKKLSDEVSEIDLILGGHDHEYGCYEGKNSLVIKSGTDFFDFSELQIELKSDSSIEQVVTRHTIDMTSQPDIEMFDLIDQYQKALQASLNISIGIIKSPLDGRSHMVRTRETILGNFVADVMATITQADAVLINSGTFRSDRIHEEGKFLLSDVLTILPIKDTIVTIEVTGQQLIEGLENGVSRLPSEDGRYPQVSHLSFGFYENAKKGERVDVESVFISGKKIDLKAKYRLATKSYVSRGKDGYNCFKNCKVLTDPDSGPLLSTAVRNHIMNVNKLLKFEEKHSCQVFISQDGKNISSSANIRNINEAFTISDINEITGPLDIVQRDVKSFISQNDGNGDTSTPRPKSPIELDENLHIHTPNFIPPLNFTQPQYPFCYRNDFINEKLLKERSQTSELLKWQIQPLIEGRIYTIH